jgi:hypothetical protein
MAWSPTDLGTILTRIQALLVDPTTGAFPASPTVFIAMRRPDSLQGVLSDPNLTYVIVYPDAGEFDQRLLAGGGEFQCNETAAIVVEVFSALAEDVTGQDSIWLTGADGISPSLKKVLKCLTDQPLLDTDGTEITTEPMRPLSRTAPDRLDEETPLGSIGLVFEVKFFWDLGVG